MRILVLGGTKFVGHAVAADAVRRGHEVVCAARGASGAVPDGATLVKVDRDQPDGLNPLLGKGFDALVDIAPMSHSWVEHALGTLADEIEHWTFVSTISVYSDTATLGQTADAPTLAPRAEHGDLDNRMVDPDLYGAIKVASENAVRNRLGERAFIPRPGLITGPGDLSDRFGYWPARFARGGRVLVPEVGQLANYIDVRDFAAWIVDAAQRRLTGTLDAIGPAQPLPDLLAEIGEAVGVDHELVPVSPETLVAQGVSPWAGPKSLPLWLPETHLGMCAHDPEPALAAGLKVRPLADAVAGALDHERALGLDRERKAGLTPDEEAEVLG
ncbi:NAD-dependent epimerase/dehydratase family protein [Herbihabitans rhizosphaerae]|nr:NAD-dependent epimerase/dehydratase family protein [Herbihabitans rhizosphaerae]